MIATLAEKSCSPCRGGIPPLTPEEAEGYRAQAPAWALRDEATRIERTYRFRNFREAFAFVCRAAGTRRDGGSSSRHQFRVGLRDGLATHQEDQGSARERLHHRGEARSFGQRRRDRWVGARRQSSTRGSGRCWSAPDGCRPCTGMKIRTLISMPKLAGPQTRI